jgi:type IV pilus assembly protein PilW
MRNLQRGLSLIELLVALTIGTVLISGAVYIYSQSRNTHTVSDVIARLQENGRYVFSVLEPDIQLAGYYGFSNDPVDFHYIQNGSTSSLIPAAKMKASDAAVPGIPRSHLCGNNFAVNLLAAVEGGNNGYPLGGSCAAQGGGAVDEADTLTIRRSSGPPSDGKGTAKPGYLQMLVSRLSPSSSYVFADGVLPAEPALEENIVQLRDLVVRTYYISKNSTSPDTPGLPALRVKSLSGGGSGPEFSVDEEVMRGVEDLQVQFGIDTGDYDGDGTIDPGYDLDGDKIPDFPLGVATRYVNPDAVPEGFQVVSVRVWILLRAETPERGFVDQQTYKYADREYAVNDNFRRVLMSRTIQLRNGRTF